MSEQLIDYGHCMSCIHCYGDYCRLHFERTQPDCSCASYQAESMSGFLDRWKRLRESIEKEGQ